MRHAEYFEFDELRVFSHKSCFKTQSSTNRPINNKILQKVWKMCSIVELVLKFDKKYQFEDVRAYGCRRQFRAPC